MQAYIIGFICGLIVGVLGAAIVGWQWFSAVHDEVYELGISHGRERERLFQNRKLFEQISNPNKGA